MHHFSILLHLSQCTKKVCAAPFDSAELSPIPSATEDGCRRRLGARVKAVAGDLNGEPFNADAEAEEAEEAEEDEDDEEETFGAESSERDDTQIGARESVLEMLLLLLLLLLPPSCRDDASEGARN